MFSPFSLHEIKKFLVAKVLLKFIEPKNIQNQKFRSLLLCLNRRSTKDKKLFFSKFKVLETDIQMKNGMRKLDYKYFFS